MTAPDYTDKPIDELISLSGKVAAVTGGRHGLGKAITRRLAEAGATVVIGDIDEAGATATATELVEAGLAVSSMRLDATEADDIVRFADAIVEEHGRLDIWVNNAGIYPPGSTLEMSEKSWDQVMDLNLRGVFIGSREAAKRMIAADHGGVIINLSSVAGFRGSGGLSHYVTSKHGVRGLTRALAVELGPHNIRVLALAPTLIETPGIAQLTPMLEESGVSIDQMLAALPLGRLGVPDDVARVALFCASDLSSFMTGATLPVDAGQLAS